MRFEHGVLLLSAAFAALGQVLFKLGAAGRATLVDFFNWQIVGGLACYGVGTLGWILALSKLPLRVVYPYTAFTFVLVFVASVTVLNERFEARALAGIGFVLAGLYLLTSTPAA